VLETKVDLEQAKPESLLTAPLPPGGEAKRFVGVPLDRGIHETKILTSAAEITAFAESWEACRRRQQRPVLKQHPDWLRSELPKAQTFGDGMLIAALYDFNGLAGVAPFMLQRWQWHCRLGYTKLLSFPMRAARLMGESFIGVPDERGQEAILQAVMRSDVPYQMLILENIPTQSTLWSTVTQSPRVREQFWIQRPFGATPRRRIHLASTYDDYLKGFDSKNLHNIKRLSRKLERECAGDLRFERVSTREQLPEFLSHVEHISRGSWQGQKLGRVVSATPGELEQMGRRADAGWLRSYLIKKGETPLAFAIGYQAHDTYYYTWIGYDPDWSACAPGIVLLLKILEDLFADNKPQWLDFGSYDHRYKRLFGTHVHDEDTAYLIRKQMYPAFVAGTSAAVRYSGRLLQSAIDRLGLRDRVRNMMKGRQSGQQER